MKILFYDQYIRKVARCLLAKVIIISFLLIEVSCGGDIPDCPSQLCIIAGEWRLTEVYINGVKDTSSDLSKYRLTLFMPNPTTATTSGFDRTNPSGITDNGTWTISNQNDVLSLLPANTPQETYIIKSLTPRRLVLNFDYDGDKTGRVPYQFVLEPN